MEFILKPIPSPAKRRCTDRTCIKPPSHMNSVPEAAVMIRLSSSQRTDDWLRLKNICFFTALHLCRAVLAMSEMSVCPSVKRVNCEETKETCAKMFISYKRSIHLVLRHVKCLMWNDALHLKC